ncbi:GAF domain-containing protein [Variovorax terrae]|uniref:GAF domain-containing protein n=1 Tax=Variovorax terrae TaxID=2923278 RepID=A0A9X2AN65_9BURK|nr:GAF domain-containing protein [Variovorax terrae]MCJ0763475.1 GAF domain-containing protein [Variovorax terrae]
MNSMYDLDYEPDALSVQISELLVATADDADSLIDDCVPEVLRLLRDRMAMDVVFVSEFTGGQRMFRHVATMPGREVVAAGGGSPLEESWCQRVVDGRLPQYIHDAARLPASAALLVQVPHPIGTHISTPIVLRSGEVYGTLCAFSFTAHGEPNPTDLKRLQYTAQLAAQKLDRQREAERNRPPPPELTLMPLEHRRF